MKIIDQYEEVGRKAAAEFLQQKGITPEYAAINDHYDIRAMNQPIEVKFRPEKTKNYDTIILEEKKAKYILNDYDQFYYFTFCGSDYLIIHRIDEQFLHSCSSTVYNCPACTAYNRGRQQKKCYELPQSVARIYIRQNGEWLKKDSYKQFLKGMQDEIR